MNQEKLDELMKQLCKDARIFAKSDYDINLDLELESVKQVDNIIAKLKATSKNFKDEELFTLSNVLGAFVGEVVRAKANGSWLYDVSDESAPAVRLIIDNSDYPFASVVYQHLKDNPDISVYEYAKNAVERHSLN